MRLALLFPGQGTHTPGFLGRLAPHPAVRATLAEAVAALGPGALQLDSAVSLESTAAVQLTTVIAGVAVARALSAEGVSADAVAGLSVGAFAAAVASGALTFAESLALVKLRGESMAQAVPRGHGMTALLGLSERDALALIGRVGARAALYLASVNARSEVVVSGSEAALALAAEEARAMGAGARRLRLTIPSHCLLMDGVSERLRGAMRSIELRPPQVPYVSNHRARLTREPAEIAEDLILNVSRTVRWYDSMRLLYELGCRRFFETPPGSVLSNLVKDAFADARAVPLEDTPLATALAIARAP
ncbi:MAG TPA: acyltransferase domain-containing protein [Steroidobacteraceae bacterium]|nr:acyltransferase domain-containing protein [Steroidobacteraceae bacterium]